MITYKEEIMPKRSARKELEIIQDSNRSCVERGAAIVALIQSRWTQAEIADSIARPRVSISHLKTCFDDLKGRARKMCEARKMNRDACYRLASEHVSEQVSDRILERAFDLMNKRDDQRRAQHGRRTPPGQITDEDIKQAIKDVSESEKTK
jgi:hypothetical protein